MRFCSKSNYGPDTIGNDQSGSRRRAVLYSDHPGAGLLECGWNARGLGDRIVSAACEGEDRRSGRQALYRLIERMLEGEFDAIIAALGSSDAAEPRLVRLSCSQAKLSRPSLGSGHEGGIAHDA